MLVLADQHGVLYEGGRIMQWIKEYLLCVLAAAILCGIIRTLVKSKGAINAMVKLLTGLLLVITAISPFAKLSSFALPDLTDFYSSEASAAVAQGEEMAMESVSKIVKESTQEYIMDKAAYLGMSISVDVTVSQDAIPQPVSVTISGTGSPFAKNTLKKYIAQELGIPEDAQIWT